MTIFFSEFGASKKTAIRLSYADCFSTRVVTLKCARTEIAILSHVSLKVQRIYILWDGFMCSFTAPAKPINLQEASVNGLIITVTWNKPQTTVKGIKDTSKLGYYVGYRNLENNRRRQLRSSTERISLRLNGNARYKVQVKAYKTSNPAVAGPWSNSLEFKTKESGKYCD